MPSTRTIEMGFSLVFTVGGLPFPSVATPWPPDTGAIEVPEMEATEPVTTIAPEAVVQQNIETFLPSECDTEMDERASYWPVLKKIVSFEKLAAVSLRVTVPVVPLPGAVS